MRYLKMLVFALLPVVMLAMFGCGGGSGSTTQDPFGSKTPVTPNDPVFPNISTATGKLNISLTTDVPSIDVDNGQVLAIAKVKAGEAPVAGMAVNFAVLAPTNLATIQNATVTTDSNGVAMTRVTTGNTPSTTNVLLQATIKVAGQSLVSNTSFQIIRGGGVIMFSSAAGITPGGQSNILGEFSAEVIIPPEGLEPGAKWGFSHLLPFKLTDSNRNPRVGSPVSISVYSINSMNPGDVTVDFLVPPVTEPNQTTITTDSAGQGIFNALIGVEIPRINNGVNTVAVVFKAVTQDPIPVVAYVGGTYTIKTKVTPLVVTAANNSFGSVTDLAIAISGGLMPYKISSSSTSKVSVTLQSNGVTALAHLVDTSDWTTPVVITVSDAAGQNYALALTRK